VKYDDGEGNLRKKIDNETLAPLPIEQPTANSPKSTHERGQSRAGDREPTSMKGNDSFEIN
jgi:hypothetical protein